MSKKKSAEVPLAEPPAAPDAAPTPKKPRARRPDPPRVDDLPQATAPRLRFEVFEPARINRSEIRNASYNPRVIDADARMRLERELKTGAVQPIVWNRRTGNIVGGHQRVAIYDDLQAGKPYSLSVAVIDCDEREEKRRNIALNSPDLMGQYDPTRLEDLFRELQAPGLSGIEVVESAGLSQITLEALGVAPEAFLPPEEDAAVHEILEDEEKVRALKEVKSEHKKRARLEAERSALRQVAFVLPEEDLAEVRRALFERLGLPGDYDSPFVPGWRLLHALKLKGGDGEGADVPEEAGAE